MHPGPGASCAGKAGLQVQHPAVWPPPRPGRHSLTLTLTAGRELLPPGKLPVSPQAGLLRCGQAAQRRAGGFPAAHLHAGQQPPRERRAVKESCCHVPRLSPRGPDDQAAERTWAEERSESEGWAHEVRADVRSAGLEAQVHEGHSPSRALPRLRLRATPQGDRQEPRFLVSRGPEGPASTHRLSPAVLPRLLLLLLSAPGRPSCPATAGRGLGRLVVPAAD